MKKALILVLSLFAIYFGVWWQQTGKIKAAFIQFAKEQGITYDAIHRKGFPGQFAVVVDNPYHLKGQAFIGANLFSQDGIIELKGKWDQELAVEGQFTLTRPKILKYLHNRQELLKDLTIDAKDVLISQDDKVMMKIANGQMDFHDFSINGNQIDTRFSFQAETVSGLSLFDTTDTNNFQGTFGLSYPLEQGGRYSLKIEECSSKNSFGYGSLKGEFDLEMFGSEFSAHVAMLTEGKYEKAMPPLNKDRFFIQMEPLFEALPNLKMACITHWDQLNLLFPNLPALGSMQQELDFSVSGLTLPTLVPQTLIVNKCHHHSDAYAMDLTANVNFENTTVTFDMTNHRAYLSDCIAFYNRNQPFLSAVAGDLPVLKEAVATKMAGFLESLCDVPSKESVHLQIQVGPQEIRVGSKSMEELQIALLTLGAELLTELQ